MADRYSNFKELKSNNIYRVDYKIANKVVDASNLIIFTPHGGSIESGTSEIVKETAKILNSNYYSFEGIKNSGNTSLHITSTNFDESVCVDMVSKCDYAIAIHGSSDTDSSIMVGGLDSNLCEKVKESLTKNRFYIKNPTHGLGGINTNNIVNKTKTGKGVQLELAINLRQSFFVDDVFSSSNRKNKTQAFYDFCNILADSIKESIEEVDLKK